jgi:hypothetical protein
VFSCLNVGDPQWQVMEAALEWRRGMFIELGLGVDR